MGAARRGSEIRVNTTTGEDQTLGGVVALSDGGFVAIWEDYSEGGSNSDVRGQLFDETFTPLGAEFRVNTSTAESQYSPRAVATEDGFVVVWSDFSLEGGDSSGTSVKAQLFTNAGVRVGGERVVNTATVDSQSSPDVAADADGGFIVTWTDGSAGVGGASGDSSDSAIKGQRFDASGGAVGVEFRVNTTVDGYQSQPLIASQSDGGFFVTWTDQSFTGGDSSSLGIKGQMYGPGGVPFGSELSINVQTNGDQTPLKVHALSNGSYVVAWEDPVGDGSANIAVRARIYGSDGDPVAGEIAVNTATQGGQTAPAVTATADGFVITWKDFSNGVGGAEGDTSSAATKAQLFDNAGAKVGDEILVNTRTSGFQGDPVVAATPGRGFVIAWSDYGSEVDAIGTFLQVFSADGEKLAIETIVNTATAGNQTVKFIQMMDAEQFVVVWSDTSVGVGGAGGDTSGTAIKAQVFEFAPTVIDVDAPTAGTYYAGQNLDFAVTFDEAVDVPPFPDAPRLQLEVAGQTVYANYVDASSTETRLVFRYTVGSGLEDTDGIKVVGLNSNGVLTSVEDDDAADLMLQGLIVPSTASVLIANAPPDTTAPTVSSITPPSSDTYVTEEAMTFTVNFSEAVTVAGGTPRLELDVGGETAYASYIVAGSTSTALRFRYNVESGRTDADGVEVVGLETNGATIRDGAGNDADLTITGGVQSGVLVDAVGPTVIGATGPAAGVYGAGDELEFEITLSSAVTLNGAEDDPTLAVTIGGETRQAIYSGGVPGATLTFKYTVQAGDLDADGVSVATAVNLHQNVFNDADGNPATLTGISIAGMSGVTVDAVAPTVTSIERGDDSPTTAETARYVVTFSEDVVGLDADDFVITQTATAGGEIVDLDELGDGAYGIRVGNITGDGTLRLDLKGVGVSVADAAGNTMGTAGYTAGETYTIDNTAPAAPSISLDPGSESGASGDLVTSDATPKIRGSVEPSSTVEVSIGGVYQGETTASGSGSWAFEFSTPLADGARNIIAVAKDAAGNESAGSLVLPLTIDTTAPTVAVTAGDTSLLAGQSTTVTFTFSEVPVGFIENDVTVQGGALSNFAVTGDAKIYSATFTPTTSDTAGSVGLSGSSFSDTAGNSGAAAASVSLATNVAPPPADDPPPPPPPAPVVDGVPVTTTPGTSPSGTPTQTVTIPVVTLSRPDTVGGNNVADIPIVAGSGTGAPPVLSVQTPAGYGLQASGPSSPQTAGTSLTDLIREIQAHTTAGSADQTTLTGGGGGFLGALPSSTPLLVQTITPTGGGASAQPLVINGAPATAGDPLTALVIDTRGLTSGSTVQLNNVDFAAVVGAVTVTGGAGSQVVYGDGASQVILLGEDDDELHGGGGTDTVASAGGNDQLYGDEGSDSVSGGIGADFVHGNAGADTVAGGDGNDQAYGGKDDDRISGDAGADLVWGDLGNDFLHGNAGADTIDGGLGADSVHGGQDGDYVSGGEGDDVVLGDLGDDFVQGGVGNDRVLGGVGNDIVHGGQGDDLVFGEAGDDWLSGDRGNDTLTGGSGADRFHAYAQTDRDVVLDFNLAEGDRVVVDVGHAYTVSQAAEGVIITFSAEHQLLLQGVQLSTLADGWIAGG